MRRPDERLLTTAEVCEMLGISARTLRRWRADGVVPAIKLRGVVRFRPSDIARAFAGGGAEISVDSAP